MTPSLFNFKELRRRSRASFRSTDTSSEADAGNTTGSMTPPYGENPSDPALDARGQLPMRASPEASPVVPPPIPPRPPPSNGASPRQSATAGSPVPGRKPSPPLSMFAPRIANVADGSWVYQKVLLVHGTIGESSHVHIDGTVTVTRLDDAFPPISWPAHESRFKALAYLLPGTNRLRFDFWSSKLASGGPGPVHSSFLIVHMIPPTGAPPLQLAILLAKDSPGTYDAIPARIEREGNGLDVAVRKFRMAAYLWQAFTAEQMHRNKLGRRTFRFDEEWTTGTANHRDRELGTMRSEARIHIIRCDKTVAQLRDPNIAQQNPKAADQGGLYGIAADAVRDYFKPQPGQKLYVTVLLLDAHWDAQSKLLVGHAALGGCAGDLNLAIFGSHCLQSYPSSFEEVVPAFSDCTPTDTKHVCNDCNDAGSSWEAANIGIGAHLHETGHLLGLPHRERGVMLRDYVHLHRTFVTREAYSTRTRSKGGPVSLDGECVWHRLDCLHFRSHPCFRLPSDPSSNPDPSIQGWPFDKGSLTVTSAAGIGYVEILAGDDDLCHAWIEYLPSNGGSPQRSVTLTEQELRDRLPEDKRKERLRISVRSLAGGSLDIDDFAKMCSKGASSLKIPSAVPGLSKTAFRGMKLGLSQMEGSQPQEVVFTSSVRQDRVLSKILVYHGGALDGLEFVYDDDSRQLFGKRGGKPGGDVFELDVRRGEYITGFVVRSGFWIDGIQVLTSLGRKSPLYGNANGGSSHTLIPPIGYNICGVTGSCAAWIDGFSVIITK
ncbi:hypothetical protein VTJ83DRAFT_2966 [Remersonia thermophila]|uniref:Jacalin-type lectin domain-containing protein n=1 Tax=Remersonia thermophila TaxID=72144 RepID=A0ABR4DCT1_9PEZI